MRSKFSSLPFCTYKAPLVASSVKMLYEHRRCRRYESLRKFTQKRTSDKNLLRMQIKGEKQVSSPLSCISIFFKDHWLSDTPIILTLCHNWKKLLPIKGGLARPLTTSCVWLSLLVHTCVKHPLVQMRCQSKVQRSAAILRSKYPEYLHVKSC